MNIKKSIYFLIPILIVFIFHSKNISAIENKILFKVDNEIITSIDILEELNFLKVFNPGINNLDKREQLEISKNSIIRDKIKKIEIMNFMEEIKIEDIFLTRLIKAKYSKIGLDSIESFENSLLSLILYSNIYF